MKQYENSNEKEQKQYMKQYKNGTYIKSIDKVDEKKNTYEKVYGVPEYSKRLERVSAVSFTSVAIISLK